MKILHLLSQTILTGAEVYARELIKSQLNAGHEVFVISDNIHIQLPIKWIQQPISSSSFKQKIINIKFLRNFLIKNKINVIHSHSRAASRHAYWARKNLKIGYVSTIHGKQHSSISKRLFDQYGDFKILICENLKEQFVNEFAVAKESLKILANPFSVEHFPFVEVLTDKKRIAFVGRASGPKGEKLKAFFIDYLFAFLANNKDYEIDLIIPDVLPLGEDFLSELKRNPQIHFAGPFADLAGEYSKYKLIIGAGRVAVEALLKGIPVIAMGEHCFHGLITQANFLQCLKTNFGDIGSRSKSKTVDYDLNINMTTNERKELSEKAQDKFGSKTIQEEILDTYRAALFKTFVPDHIPILMYHKVPKIEPLLAQHRIFIGVENFRKHLQFFKDQKFQTLTFQDLKKFWYLDRPYKEFPKKPLMLTFDDGYKDNLVNALPLLQEFGFRATLFLLSDHDIHTNTWDVGSLDEVADLLTLEEKKLIAKSSVFEIGSHGIDHQRLTDCNDQEVERQLIFSKKGLEADLNTAVVAFAYPFGSIDQRLPELCKNAGYDFAVNTDTGGLHLSENRFSLFRVNIFPEDKQIQLRKKTAIWYRKYYFIRRGK